MVDEYTTDASPCPPNQQQAKDRTREKTIPQPKPEPDSCEQGTSPDHEETNPDDYTFDFNSLPKDSDPSAKVVNNVIQIIGSKKVHVGTKFKRTYYFGSKSDFEAKKQMSINKQIEKLLTSKDVVKEQDINEFSLHVGNGWKNTFGFLGYSGAQVEQQEHRFHSDVSGLIHWLFVDWIQNNGSKATVEVLANALLKSKQYDALTEWSKKYDEIHN